MRTTDNSIHRATIRLDVPEKAADAILCSPPPRPSPAGAGEGVVVRAIDTHSLSSPRSGLSIGLIFGATDA
jgi:hypothetical protein